MKISRLWLRVFVFGGAVLSGLFGSRGWAVADSFECLLGQVNEIGIGYKIAPVPLEVRGKTLRERALIGLGSYMVNAQGGCNDCHTNPSYAPGGNPFLGEPEKINADGYLTGSTPFGPFLSHNLTRCQDGEPAGLNFAEFLTVMRTGKDFKDSALPPGNTPLLQVMPWPVYGNMPTCELRAVYEFLKAIPAHPGCVPGGG